VNNITLVTAFFDLKRDTWDGFSRSNNDYLEYFRFWARINNDLVVYTTADVAKTVMEIRDEFGLTHRTFIYVIDDFRTIDSEMYSSYCKQMAFKESLAFRLIKHVPESYNPVYNYLTCLKPWFLRDAAKKGHVSDFASWIDFGFNHGGEVFSNARQFNFTWSYDFPRKINLFSIRDMADLPLFEVVRTSSTSIMGAFIVVPLELIDQLYVISKSITNALSICGLPDDDQTVLEASVKSDPDAFVINQSSWHLPIFHYGNPTLDVHPTKLLPFWKVPLVKIFLKVREIYNIFKYSYSFLTTSLRQSFRG